MAFNIRVYGILINDRAEILLSDENRFGTSFTKFPGGGLEFGEGIIDCLKREFREEIGIDIRIKELFYLTDFFQVSAFDKNDQLVSIYYLVDTEEVNKIRTVSDPSGFSGNDQEVHRWVHLQEINESDVTFPVDKKVVEMLKNNCFPNSAFSEHTG
ncbi:MAG: NUDIX domain-containing protein [Brumimicrobium sp.]|nr:NUDIX domain-containing protein [Brumimicrobium sp.]